MVDRTDADAARAGVGEPLSRARVNGAVPGRLQPARGLRSPLFALCLAQFVLQVDFSIVNLALSTIRRELDFSDAGLQWVVTSYALTFGSLLLLGGRLGDRVGRRRLMLIGLSVFGVASLIGGVATSTEILVAARFVQGAGAAMVAPAIVSTLTSVYPEGVERTRALGIWTAATAIGGLTGVVGGGFLTEYLGWRAVFLVNLPAIAVLIVVIRGSLPASRGDRETHVSPFSSTTATLGIAALIFSLHAVESHGPSSASTLIGVGAMVAAGSAFRFAERRAARPMIPLEFFEPVARRTAVVVMVLLGGVIAGYIYFISLYLQRVVGYGAAATAVALMPGPVAMFATSSVARRLTGRFGAEHVLVGGLALVFCGQLLLSQVTSGWTTSTYVSVVFPGIVLTAAGFGLAFPALSITVMRQMGPGEHGLAGGVITTAQQVGMALGLAILATVAAATTSHEGGLLVAGYRASYLGGAALTGLAGALVVRSLRSGRRVGLLPRPEDL